MGKNQTRGRESRKDQGQSKQKSHKTILRERRRDAKGGPSIPKIRMQSRQKQQASQAKPTFAKPAPKPDIHERQERGMKSKKNRNERK